MPIFYHKKKKNHSANHLNKLCFAAFKLSQWHVFITNTSLYISLLGPKLVYTRFLLIMAAIIHQKMIQWIAHVWMYDVFEHTLLSFKKKNLIQVAVQCSVTVKYQPDLNCSSLLHPPNLILRSQIALCKFVGHVCIIA